MLRVKKEIPEFSDIYYHLGSLYGRMGEKGLSHFYFGTYFRLKGEWSNALNQFRKAVDLLESRGSITVTCFMASRTIYCIQIHFTMQRLRKYRL
jgi:tetratricopeptide (TPR) repeat protein